jgi:glycerol uptake facilitator-like aquaporin
MVNALPLLAEFLGTFLLTLSFIASGNALVIGATLAVVVLLIKNLSGAYVNPAVTFTMYQKGTLSTMELASYVAVQLLGAYGSLYAYNVFA